MSDAALKEETPPDRSVEKTEKILIVPIDVIVNKIAPLCRVPKPDLYKLVKSYDKNNSDGLSEEEWQQFCTDNRAKIASLGITVVDFDRSGEYTIVTLERTVSEESGAKKPLGSSIAQNAVTFLEGFGAGGIAGAVSKTIIAPFDRVKIIFQVDSTRRFSLREAFRLGVQTVKEFGVTGLWIGNGATMLRIVPYAAITYSSFDVYLNALKKISPKNPDGTMEEKSAVTVRFICGSLAGATSTTFTYPLDLMRARFAAHSSSGKTRFPSYRAAFRDATKKDGLRSLYFGLFPTLVGIMPYAGCSFACFGTMKQYIVKYYGLKSDRDIPTWQRLIAGALSGLIAQSATYPFDIVRRRMQVTPGRYRGVVHALTVIHREEGLRQGLYKGLAMNWIKGPIATSTSFTVNDLLKRRTRDYYQAASTRTKEPVVTVPEALVCGGIAAGTAKLWTLPFDKLRITYQLGLVSDKSIHLKQLPDLFLKEFRRNPNMWSSGQVAMLRVIPYGALTYSFYDMFKEASQRLLYTHEPTMATNFLAGASAAAFGTFLVYPLELLRARVALLPQGASPKFQSYYWVLRAIAKRSGLGSLWKGCYISMLGVGVLAGTGFATYEYLKERFECHTFLSRFGVGMLSGLMGQVVTYPLSVVKRNRQIEQMTYKKLSSANANLSGFRSAYAVFYRRMPFSFTLSSLTFGISFAVNDNCRDVVVAARQDMLHDFIFSS